MVKVKLVQQTLKDPWLYICTFLVIMGTFMAVSGDKTLGVLLMGTAIGLAIIAK